MKREKTNLLIIINCSLACMFLLIAGSLAAYTSLSNAKRTISTVGSKQLFSSNILLEYEKEDDIQSKFMSFSKDADSTFKVSVCNYAQDNPEKYASEDINYTIKVSLLDQNGKIVTDQNVLSQYKRDNTPFSELKDQKDTLSSGRKSEHVHSITVPAKYMKGYKIKITAVPDKTGYRSLGRIISFSEDVSSSEWKIDYLNDELAQNAYDLGCINTRLTGSEYAVLTLTWDTDHVQIDPWFLEDIKKSTVYIESGNNSLTFKAGGDSGFNQYDITFYRTNPVHGDDSTPEKWDAIKSYITLTSEKIEESGKKAKK
ncbi:hypothetical protein [Blautia sp.]|uniref:hypothetical protein n=1 Tax=Blautia sp. TaxID=1955243 RepID=UPI00257C698B|nr:hypothetical protein [Blautia sp.]